MSAISKRLLSWLCVIAMVLSFVPVMNLSNFAVATKAAEEIVYGSANLEGVDAAILEQMNKGNAIDNSDEAFAQHLANKTCPICGDISGMEGGGWVPLTAAKNMGGSQNKKYHFYYEDSVETCTGNMIGFYKSGDNDAINNTACVWLKSTNNITNTSNRCVMLSGANNTVNFFGQGTITTDIEKAAESYNMFQLGSGTLNLYGGNFIYQHPQADFRKAAIRIAGESAVANIYAGAKIGPETQDASKVCQNVQYTSAGTVNMFGGEIRNGVAPAWGYAGNVTVSSGGKFNMYGGTISGGTFLSAVTDGMTNAATIGGNVMVGGKNQQVYYNEDGSANYTCTAGTFKMYGGTITGGKANNGGNGGGNINVYHSGASATILGGTIENGYAKQYGGNIQSCGGDITIGGTALIANGESGSSGGNLHVNHASCALTISGGKFVGGAATGASANGGSVFVDKCQSVNITGGIFDGGNAGNHGGNLYVGGEAIDKVATISNATFQNGVAANQGGNISTAVSVTMENCTVANGTGRKGGGNINVGAQSKVLTLKDCTVYGGWVSGAMAEDGTLTAPTGAQWGGNIRTWGSDVVIDGGLYHSGSRGVNKENANQGNNIACLASLEKSSTSNVNEPTLTIGGNAIIVGDVNASFPSKNTPAEGAEQLICNGTSIVLKDAPQIVPSYELADGTVVKATTGGLNIPTSSVGSIKADISGLSADAKICVSGVALDRVISIADANAANVASCFSVYGNDELVVKANAENELVVSEIVYEFEAPVKPEAALGGQNVSDEAWAEVVKAAKIQVDAKNFKLDAQSKAMCPACGEVVTWTEATYPNQKTDENGKYHFYLDADTKVNPQYNWGALNGKNMTMCLMLLNGETEKNIGGLFGVRNAADGCVVNVMGEGILVSDGTRTSDSQFGVVSVQGKNNIINLYGGTFIYTGDGEGRAKDDEGKYQPNGVVSAAAVNVKGSNNTVNMFDGVVIGPETQDLTKVNYNVRMEVALAKASNTFNMYGGLIRNGVTNDKATSGNVHLHYNSKFAGTKPTFNMYGGTIENGSYVQGEGITSVAAKGGNIFAGAGAQLTIYGGTIQNGEAQSNGGNIYANDSSVTKVTINGGTITGGEAQYGGNIYAYAELNLNEYALVENGAASKNGGNIYVNGKNGDVIQNAGSEVRNGTAAGTGGGNVFVNTNGTYDMTGGKIYDGKNVNSGGNANAGNVLVQGTRKETDAEAQTEEFTDAYFNMSGDAEIYGGIAPNQAGNVRVYIGTFTMTDNAKIYDGDGQAKAGSVDDIWLVDGNLEMSGNAAIIASENSGASVNVTVYRRNNTVTLSGNASITGGAKPLSLNRGTHYNYKTPLHNTLQIDNSWTGTTSLTLTNYYAPGATLLAEDVICGTMVDGVLTKGGSFEGKLLYAPVGNCPLTGVEGDVVVPKGNGVVKADGTSEWFDTAAEALAAYQHGVDQFVILCEDAAINGDVVIDLAGQNITLSGKGKVYGMDSANGTFEAFGEITVAEGAEIEYAPVQYNPLNDRRFVAVMAENKLSFHYLTMSFTDVTLRTEGAGVYYKTKFKCDPTLAAAIDGYGTILSLSDMPGSDFQTEEDINLATSNDGPIVLDENGECLSTSGAVVGILKEGRTAEENQQIAEMKIYANAYVKVGENYILYKGENPYAEPDPANDVIAYSLKDIMVEIEGIWDSYSEEDKVVINGFYETWKDLGLSAWAAELESIAAFVPTPVEPTPEPAPIG